MAHGTLNTYELAQRIIDVDYYEALDAYDDRETATSEIMALLDNDPLTIIDGLLNTIEDLTA